MNAAPVGAAIFGQKVAEGSCWTDVCQWSAAPDHLWRAFSAKRGNDRAVIWRAENSLMVDDEADRSVADHLEVDLSARRLSSVALTLRSTLEAPG